MYFVLAHALGLVLVFALGFNVVNATCVVLCGA